MQKNGSKNEIQRLINATRYSLAGFNAALQNEAAFRLEVILVVILAPLASWLGDTGVERALLVGSLLLVLIVEILNSSIEAAVDRISTEHHTLAGRAKDMGSAAVFLSLVNVVMIWLLVLV
ncbi:MAG: diacylglycerol kinase [Gammaproteobacteria bacterium]